MRDFAEYFEDALIAAGWNPEHGSGAVVYRYVYPVCTGLVAVQDERTLTWTREFTTGAMTTAQHTDADVAWAELHAVAADHMLADARDGLTGYVASTVTEAEARQRYNAALVTGKDVEFAYQVLRRKHREADA